MENSLYFNGFGLITALGDTVDGVIANACRGPGEPAAIDIEQSEGGTRMPYFSINAPGISSGPDRIEAMIDRVVQQALDEAGLTAAQRLETGLFVGSTSYDMYRCETALKAAPVAEPDIAGFIPSFNVLASYIQRRFALHGPAYTFNTACTSSANALMYAADSIRRGDIRHALVLGLEFFNEITALGFNSLELISQQGMRPFAATRDGLYLGEGCGAVVVSAEPQGAGFAFAGGASLGDTYSLTASNPDGLIIKAVIDKALAEAGIGASDIAIIKTHGTASLSNDEAEAAGLRAVFGDKPPPIVALKPLIGHTLGACGINELIIFVQALQRGTAISCPLTIADHYSLRQAHADDVPAHGHYLLNYFGFGGNNTALVIRNA